MHCHEYLKEQLQQLLNQLKSEKWRQNCTELGAKFESNWGRDWRQKIPPGFVSMQELLVAVLKQLVAHDDVDDESLFQALSVVSEVCAENGWFMRFVSDPHDQRGQALEITQEVCWLFEDVVEVATKIRPMLRNSVYCPQNVDLRGLLARLDRVTQGATSCVAIPTKTIPAAASLHTERF